LLEQARGADLIILPEMFTTGFSMESETLAEPENGPTSKWLRVQAAKLDAVITGSIIVQVADGSHRNRLLWARPDGEVWHYDKRHLFRMAGEHNHFTPGERQVQFELKGWRVRPLICYDLAFPGLEPRPSRHRLVAVHRQLAGRPAPALEPFATGTGD